jgi:hypothetical protein
MSEKDIFRDWYANINTKYFQKVDSVELFSSSECINREKDTYIWVYIKKNKFIGYHYTFSISKLSSPSITYTYKWKVINKDSTAYLILKAKGVRVKYLVAIYDTSKCDKKMVLHRVEE